MPSSPAQIRLVDDAQSGTPGYAGHPMHSDNQSHCAVNETTPGDQRLTQDSASVGGSDYPLPLPNGLESGGEFTPFTSVLQDDDWYNMSFADVDIEQFIGLEPSTLFQQGWNSLT